MENDNMNSEERYDFELSNLITEARIYAGLTQEKLAKIMRTKQSSIARAESGAVLPSHKFLQRVAKAIGTELLPPKFAHENFVVSCDTKSDTQNFLFV